MKNDCLFCKIVSGEVPCNKQYEDDLVLIFEDINPESQIHHLAIPKQHFENITQLSSENPTLCAKFMAVLTNHAKNVSPNSEFKLIFNSGASAGQSVFHIHAHILAGKVL